jgi:basic membrane protein A
VGVVRGARGLTLLGLACVLSIGACTVTTASHAPTAAPTPSRPQASEGPAYGDYKACLAVDENGLGDNGVNDLARKGLEDAAALGFDTDVLVASSAEDYVPNIEQLLDEGCRTVVTVGIGQTQATVDETLANPDVSFAQVDVAWDEDANGPTPPNYTGLTFRIDEASALAGYLAAGVSRSGIVATFGGEPTPGTIRAMNGLVAGVRMYNEARKADVKVLGWNVEAGTGTFVGGDQPWTDAAKGEQLAKRFLGKGADIVYPVAGTSGDGAIQAMAAEGGWAIGADVDRALSLPDDAGAILTSTVKGIDTAVLDVIRRNAGGDLGGGSLSGSLKNGGVDLAPFHELDSQVPAELKVELDQLRAGIIDGSIRVADYLGP